ncbi:MAG: hypothetical protein R8G66_17115 [Cytophagales bacterium]|nr:hypothetical protein [Cytophagales bacterium]
MTTQQVAWTVDGDGNLAVLRHDQQSPSYTADWRILDLTVSKAETVMVLTVDGAFTVVHHAPEVFPLQWSSTVINLDKVKHTPAGQLNPEITEVVKIDAAPDDTLYMVLNSGKLAKAQLSKESGAEVEATLVDGVENVKQISAAPDGLVWVVCSDPKIGSVVKWMDPEKGKWKVIPDLRDALQVTGGPEGKAYIINAYSELAYYTQKGAKTNIPCENYGARVISIGPDGRLWMVTSYGGDGKEGGSVVCWTDNDGENWNEVPESNANNLDAGLMKIEEFA